MTLKSAIACLTFALCAITAGAQNIDIEPANDYDPDYMVTLSDHDREAYMDWVINGTYNKKFEDRQTEIRLQNAGPEQRELILQEQAARDEAYITSNAGRTEQRIAEAKDPDRIVATCQVSDHEIINLTAGMFENQRPAPIETLVKCNQIRVHAMQEDTKMLHKLTGGAFIPSADMDVLVVLQNDEGIAYEKRVALAGKETHDLTWLLFDVNNVDKGSYVYTLYINGENVEQELIQIGG